MCVRKPPLIIKESTFVTEENVVIQLGDPQVSVTYAHIGASRLIKDPLLNALKQQKRSQLSVELCLFESFLTLRPHLGPHARHTERENRPSAKHKSLSLS